MLDSQVSHLPWQSARQRVHKLDSAGFPRLTVPKASLDFSNLMVLSPLVGLLKNKKRRLPPKGNDAFVLFFYFRPGTSLYKAGLLKLNLRAAL
jgi:hypothetical protein